jgi:hypothetical protein
MSRLYRVEVVWLGRKVDNNLSGHGHDDDDDNPVN